MTRPFLPLAVLAASLPVGCGPSFWARDADEEVQALLESYHERTLGDLEEWVIRPHEETPEQPPGERAEAAPEERAKARTEAEGQGKTEEKAEARTEAEGQEKTEEKAQARTGEETQEKAAARQPADRAGAKEEAGQEPGAAEPAPSQPALKIDLATALRMAVKSNREYLTRRETLYQQGLSLSLAEFDFGPQLAATVAAVWGDAEGAVTTQDYSGALTASQILPTGGTLALDYDVAHARDSGPGPGSWSSQAGVRLSQPLLRGAGYEASHEALTQSRRNMVYAVRDFELFRQDFSIRVARDFFALVTAGQLLANQERTYQEAVFDRKKAEALYSVDRNDDEQVFRARRREVETENDLIDGRAQYQRQVDTFKITLGLPTSTPVEIAPDQPVFESLRIDVDLAIEAALHNQLRLLTERQQLEDVERAVRLAENGLLPDVNLDVSYVFAGLGGDFAEASPDEWSANAGISVELPLQRTPERNAYRNALIALDRARRQYTLTEDQLELDVRDQVRQLESIEKQIVLQGDQVEQEKKAVAVTEIRYEAGVLDNRDLLEARQALLDAQNALIRLKVDHFIRRLELLRELGLLFIDSEGMWR